MNKIQDGWSQPSCAHTENGKGHLTDSDLDNERIMKSQTKRESSIMNSNYGISVYLSGHLDDFMLSVSCFWREMFLRFIYINKNKQWITKKTEI